MAGPDARRGTDITEVINTVRSGVLAYDIRQLKNSESAKSEVHVATKKALEKFADMGWAA